MTIDPSGRLVHRGGRQHNTCGITQKVGCPLGWGDEFAGPFLDQDGSRAGVHYQRYARQPANLSRVTHHWPS